MANPWVGVKKYFGSASTLSGDDADRVRAYTVYEDFYWNTPDTFKLILRGDNSSPIYLPSCMRIVETTHRFLAVDWDFVVDGQDELITDFLRNLFVRENMYSKFSTQKRYGLIRGDAFWHIVANPLKVEGQRISINELHPGQVFLIVDNENKTIGYHIVDEVKDPVDATKKAHRRQTYRKTEEGITSSLEIFELGKWDDRNPDVETKKISVVLKEELLPPEINQLPLYHIKNRRNSYPWGSSEIRGIESIIAATNQAVSDQDLALVLAGLGVYWTNSGPARDDQGNRVALRISPGTVIDSLAADSTFARVAGITSVTPSIDHMNFMQKSLDGGIGIPAIATGQVEVSIAESGIALYLQMAPLLARCAENEQEILGITDQMLFDLVTKWIPSYEGLRTEAKVSSVVGDPLPKNRDAEIREIIDLFQAGLITFDMCKLRLTKLGYEFPEGTQQPEDPFNTRLSQEVEVE